ncbi:MAG: 2-dehydropantoate 2-reductase [Dehalobacterium sp.]
MKTLIIGAGAMGCLVGALLAESGVQVALFDIAREQVEAIRKQGLIIERGNSRRTVKVQATTDLKEVEQADLLVVLVKAYHTQKAIEGVRSCISEETLVLTLQNGAGNLEVITDIIPARQVFAGVTSHGAMLLAPGIVRHSGGGKTFIGPMDQDRFTQGEEITRLFNQAGIETVTSRDIQGVIWTKLIANAAINPLTAIIGCANGELLKDESLLDIMESIVNEGKQVAGAAGIKVLREDMFEYVKSVCEATRENKSSMLMDVLKVRPTEVDAINGMIAVVGRKYGVTVPVNQCMAGLVHGIEAKNKKKCNNA